MNETILSSVDCTSDELTLVNKSGNVKVEWVNLGEGLSGDYDETDPEDLNLLRFDVYLLNRDTGEWEDPGNASYCTQMPADTSPEVLVKALQRIMDEVESPLEDGSSYKRILEELSWMEPSWFEKVMSV